VFERFTDRARVTLALAQDEALSLNHGFIGTEHILLALLSEGEGVGARALHTLGITHEAVRIEVLEAIGFSATDPNSSPPFTPRAKKVLELSLRESLQLGHNYIGTEHLLLGLVREGEGVAATVLVNLGLDLTRVRLEVMSLISEPQSEGRGREAGSHTSRVTTKRGNPCCPNCRADLASEARYRTIPVPSDTEGTMPMTFDVVFCVRCGTTLHMFKSDATS
jgi:ATP-dependent Clp protease ATP-binding subunit ClpC